MIDVRNINGFASRDLQGTDRWESRDETTIPFTTQFPVLTVVGTPTYDLRWRLVGKMCQGQITFSSSTSIASTAGTSYFLLPVTAGGICGIATMMNLTTNAPLGIMNAIIDTVNSRCYLPAQAASANLFGVFFEYEVA